MPFSDITKLTECLQSVIHEQQRVCTDAAGTTLSLQRLQQQLTVLERYYIALARHRPPEGVRSPTRKKQNAEANLSKQKM